MKKKSKYLCSLLLVIFLGLAPFSPVVADELPTFELDQIVVTATKTPIKLAESGENVSVVTKEEIEKMHYRNLGDVLRHVPGVTIVSQGYAGAQGKVYLNGTDRVLVLLDGRRISRAEGIGSGRAGMDLNYLSSLSNIERIEIIKGNAGALYGSDAVGGVINIITKKGGPNRTTLETSLGSWGTKNYQLTNQGEDKNLSWLLTVNKQKQDYFYYHDSAVNQDKKMPNSSYDSQAYTLKVEQKISDKKNLDIAFQYNESDTGMPGNAKDLKLNDHKHEDGHSLDLAYNLINSEQTNQQIKVYRNFHTKKISGSESSRYENTTWGSEWQINHQLNEQHLLTGGISWWEANVESTNYAEKKDMNNNAYYLQDQWKLNDNLTLTPGIRLDHYNQFGSRTTPRISMNYKVSPKTNLYASYSKVFNAPRLDDLYYNDQFMPGNPDLKPEKGKTYTIGLNQKFDNTLEGQINYFSSQLDDAIGWAADPTDPNGYTWRPYNAEKAKIRGIDLNLTKKASAYLSLFTGYEYKKIEELQSGSNEYKRNTNFPLGTYKLGLSYNKDRVSFNLNGKRVYGQDATKFTGRKYWLWDAALNIKIKENSKIFLKVNNLTNSSYEEIAGSKSYYYPCPGRSYLLGIDYTF